MLLKYLKLYQSHLKEQRPHDTGNKGKLLKRQKDQAISREGKNGRKRLGREGWDLAATDLLAILSIDIDWPFFNLKGFPKFPVMELRNSSNNTSFLDTYMMIGFLHMLC